MYIYEDKSILMFCALRVFGVCLVCVCVWCVCVCLFFVCVYVGVCVCEFARLSML